MPLRPASAAPLPRRPVPAAMTRAIEALIWSPRTGCAVALALSRMAKDAPHHPPTPTRRADPGRPDWHQAIMTVAIPGRMPMAPGPSERLELAARGA